MCPHPNRRRWPTILRNAALGLLLGGLQILVVGDAISLWAWAWPWWLYIVVGALWYLLIPGWAGFLTARQRGDPNVGVGAGCLVGSTAILMTLAALAAVDALMPHPRCGVDCPGAGRLLALLVLFETLGGAVATVLGGSVGEALGLRHFAARYQRRKRAEHPLD
jgi:hypothetical protein